MIVPRYYEDLSVLHENTMPNRSYYIPASERMDTLIDDRAGSDRFHLLSGDWKFRFYNSIYDLKEAFYEIGYDVSSFDTLPVPSNWQMHGYDLHHYINSRYPFPADPPYVPQDNPCGAYVTKFNYSKNPAAPLSYLNFEGVDSCFYVWLNGKYIGYSQVAHATSEFDVTEALTEGENTLAVLVLKWCDGSYLECQDKFRWSGIFRDVYLLDRPKQMLWDYFITNKLEQGSATVTVRAKTLPEDAQLKISLYDRENNLVASAVAEEAYDSHYSKAAQLTVADPVLWNAEQPYLYTIVLETEGETIVDYVGLREICIRDCVVYINGAPVKFYGVNRHESDPVKGYVIDLDQTKRELKLLKEYNFNGIRTSHYPSHPLFYHLCDRYGFYVIDEADIEAHGAANAWFEGTKLHDAKRWNEMIADDPKFIGSILDRVQRMVLRDKNRPSAVIWSMGNESAYGCGFERALEWTKMFDPSRLTHYESAQYVGDDRKYDYSNLDLWSEMYASLEFMDGYLEKGPDKPFIQCEYSHAMGNGPGDLEDYFQKFNADPRFCGGFVWEFLDHAVFKGYAENGKAMYFYGGDHNEAVNDGNFCMDGLVYPDRRPHTGIMEFKNVHRPVRASYDQTTGTATLRNHLGFLDIRDYLTISYEVTCDGVVISNGLVGETPSVLPGCTGTFALNVEVPSKGKCYLKLSYSLKNSTELLEAGHPLGFDEFLLENADGRNQESLSFASNTAGRLSFFEDDEWVTVVGEAFTYKYSKRTGLWESMVHNGKKLMEKPMELNIWRAPTDNDRNIKLTWMLAKHQLTHARAYETTILEVDGSVRIENTMSIGGMTTRPVVRMVTVWTVNAAGEITLTMDAAKDKDYNMLPRFGIRMFLPKKMEQVAYYGLGPTESYADKCRASYHGRFETTVSELHEDYLFPQENGSHCDCDFVRVSGSDLSLAACGAGFSFNASHYTQEELTEKGHNFELEESDYTVLCLDYAQNGIGSNSCGPVLNEKYRLNAENFTFALRLIPGC